MMLQQIAKSSKHWYPLLRGELLIASGQRHFTVLKHRQLTSCHFHFNELLNVAPFSYISWKELFDRPSKYVRTFHFVLVVWLSSNLPFHLKLSCRKGRFQTWAVSIEQLFSPNCHWLLTIAPLLQEKGTWKIKCFRKGIVSWCHFSFWLCPNS